VGDCGSIQVQRPIRLIKPQEEGAVER
jgi:hypothetical protein